MTSFRVNIRYLNGNVSTFRIHGDKIPKEIREEFKHAEDVLKFHFSDMSIRCQSCQDAIPAKDIWMLVARGAILSVTPTKEFIKVTPTKEFIKEIGSPH